MMTAVLEKTKRQHTYEVYENVSGVFEVFGQATEGDRVNSKLLEGFGVDQEKVF